MQKTNNSISRIFFSDKFQHIIIWVVSYFLLFSWGLWGGPIVALIIAGMSVIAMIGITIIMTQLLIPKLLILPGRKFFYILFSILIIALLTFVCAIAEEWILLGLDVSLKHEIKLIFPLSKFFVLFTVTFTVCNVSYLSKKMEEDASRREKLQTEKKDLELKVLKTQINSHFLFNALNNIYSMIYFKDQETAVYVLKLSQMMRYIIEDCEADYTAIGKEVEYIDNYIEFQQLRFETAKEDIIFTKEILDFTVKIPPMILQPIVENCFKHCSLDLDKNSYIHMHLKIDKKHLSFSAENTHPLIKSDAKDGSSRIGLMNIQRRLDLIYRDNYILDIQNEMEIFRVNLEINFE